MITLGHYHHTTYLCLENTFKLIWEISLVKECRAIDLVPLPLTPCIEAYIHQEFV